MFVSTENIMKRPVLTRVLVLDIVIPLAADEEKKCSYG
jgi:hypothetical protein